MKTFFIITFYYVTQLISTSGSPCESYKIIPVPKGTPNALVSEMIVSDTSELNQMIKICPDIKIDTIDSDYKKLPDLF